MPNTIRNESRPGIYQKLSTVKRWIEQCVCEWVTEGKSYRELSNSERLERMAENLERSKTLIDKRPKSKRPNYLPGINPSHVKEIMPRSEVWTTEVKYQCLVEARKFAEVNA